MLSNYLEQICNAFPDAICVTDKDGIIVLTNIHYADVYGFSQEEVNGRSVIEMEQEGLFNNILNPVVIKTGEVTTHMQHTTNGRELVLEGHPIKDQDGNVLYCLTFIRDVTSLVKMKEQLSAQSELLSLFQQMSRANYEQPRYPRVLTSAAMCKLYEEMHSIADTDATVLILGETGVGKDVLAHSIHDNSRRKDKTFVKIDCGSIPENLIETELFGYEGGSFSGASKNGKPGLIEAGNGGTVFLDEIGELPLPMQSRLLRVLQDGEVMRVGATRVQKLDVRFIAATNKKLEKEVEKGRFRSDLYYRLKVAVLTVPSLCQRKADIVPLARGFLNYYGAKYNKQKSFTEEAETELKNYNWPGNVRELENLVQSLVVTGNNNVIDRSDLPFTFAVLKKKQNNGTSDEHFSCFQLSGQNYKEIMRELEYDLLEALLDKYGSITEISRKLSVDRSTIFRKVRDMKKVRDIKN